MSLAPLLLAVPLFLGQFGQDPNEVMSKAGRVGVSLEKRGDVLVITEVEPGTSADTVGLKVGDQILRIDLDNTERFSQSDGAAALRGSHGTRVTLTILPRAQMMPKRVDVMRDVRVYLAHDNSTKMDAEDVAATAAAFRGTEAPPDFAPPTVDVRAGSVLANGVPVTPEVQQSFDRGAGDVGTCLGALRDLLPAGFPAEFGADITVRKDAITVRTDPASGDLASCLGRKAAGWKLPAPKKKEAPLVFRATWSWTQTSEPVPTP